MPDLSKILKFVIPAVVAAVVIIILALILSSIKKLESYEMAIKYDTWTRTLSSQTFSEGVHLGPVGYEFIKFPSVYRSVEHDDLTCLNQDGVHIKLDVSYQYITKKQSLQSIIQQFKNAKNYERVLQYTGESAIKEVCSTLSTADFQSDRDNTLDRFKLRLQERYDALGAMITDIQTRDIRRPSEFENAVRMKEETRTAVGIVIEERPRLITAAQTEVQKARKQLNITIAKAKSDAKIIIQRAELESEGILAYYTEQAKALAEAKKKLKLQNNELVNYFTIRTLASAANPVFVSMKAPAKSSMP